MFEDNEARASLWGALASLCLLFFSPASASNTSLDSLLCPNDQKTKALAVRHIIDGDTLILANGKHVRLIGINSPELGRDQKPHQPLALEARRELARIIEQNGGRINLRFDREHQDRYGRQLAHLFDDRGTSVEAILLTKGLATILPIPPNTWNMDCYSKIEEQARKAKRGVWALKHYQPISKSTAFKAGYSIIRGRITRIGKSRRSIWLNLEQGIAVRIDRKDLKFFDRYNPTQLRHRTVEARGWAYKRNQQWRVNIRHPYALTLISDPADSTIDSTNK